MVAIIDICDSFHENSLEFIILRCTPILVVEITKSKIHLDNENGNPHAYPRILQREENERKREQKRERERDCKNFRVPGNFFCSRGGNEASASCEKKSGEEKEDNGGRCVRCLETFDVIRERGKRGISFAVNCKVVLEDVEVSRRG